MADEMAIGTGSDLLGRWLRSMRKRSAIRLYLTKLPRQLVEDYGHGGPYRPAQVDASIIRAKLASEFGSYAHAIFCDEAELRRQVNWPQYEALRSEVAARFLGCGPSFTYSDVSRYIGEHGHSGHGDSYGGYGGDFGHGGHDGGHGGGDSGGGH
jgi:hypothetical protein